MGGAPQSSDTAGNVMVSFITPLRNGEQYLPEMLESVLAQSYAGPMELSVFDDGSADNSNEILRAWEVRKIK